MIDGGNQVPTPIGMEQRNIFGGWEAVEPEDVVRQTLVNDCASRMRLVDAIQEAYQTAGVHAQEAQRELDRWHEERCAAMGAECPVCAAEAVEEEEWSAFLARIERTVMA